MTDEVTDHDRLSLAFASRRGRRQRQRGDQPADAGALGGPGADLRHAALFADRDEPERFFRRRAAAWEALSAALPEGSPAIRLGAEVHYFDGMSRSEALPALCLEGTRLLEELPFGAWSRRVYTELEQVRQRGLTLVAAHVERYLAWNRAGALESLEDQGVLFQCNAEFILTNRSAKKVLRMLADGRVWFLGSDAHNTGERAPELREAWERVGQKLGLEALAMLEERAARFGLKG